MRVDHGRVRACRPIDRLPRRRSVRGAPRESARLAFLNVHEFITLHDLRQKLQAWQDDYNHHRPHGSLGHLTPCEYVQKWSEQPTEAATLQF
ncbi:MULTISPECIES: integrase core domain-containing protein [Achromobacter]|uniref:integrase core domain-containing protein n=1 Tax=Achromobacter TaxID=222 RepID=UPI0025C1D620|nr:MULTISPECIES: integrase core domain-containing protein [Achromobacter]